MNELAPFTLPFNDLGYSVFFLVLSCGLFGVGVIFLIAHFFGRTEPVDKLPNAKS